VKSEVLTDKLLTSVKCEKHGLCGSGQEGNSIQVKLCCLRTACSLCGWSCLQLSYNKRSPGIKYFAGSKFFSSDLTLSWINLLVLFSQNRPASLLPHMGASLWYPAGQHVLFPDLSFRKKKSRDNLPVNFQYRAVLYKHTCNTRMKGRRTRRHCQGQLFFRVLTWPKGDQGIIFQIVASVRDPSCIKGLNLAGMAPKESFCQATPPLRYWEMLKTSALSTDSESKSLSLSK
jgi:hypothetical protein